MPIVIDIGSAKAANAISCLIAPALGITAGGLLIWRKENHDVLYGSGQDVQLLLAKDIANKDHRNVFLCEDYGLALFLHKIVEANLLAFQAQRNVFDMLKAFTLRGFHIERGHAISRFQEMRREIDKLALIINLAQTAIFQDRKRCFIVFARLRRVRSQTDYARTNSRAWLPQFFFFIIDIQSNQFPLIGANDDFVDRVAFYISEV